MSNRAMISCCVAALVVLSFGPSSTTTTEAFPLSAQNECCRRRASQTLAMSTTMLSWPLNALSESSAGATSEERKDTPNNRGDASLANDPRSKRRNLESANNFKQQLQKQNQQQYRSRNGRKQSAEKWDNHLSVHNNNWLESTTKTVLRVYECLEPPKDTFPMGQLTKEDVVTITKLMVEWSRRRSGSQSPLTVERLLKRIVDDLKFGNNQIQVYKSHYTIAINAWGRSGVPGAAQRAQSIHDGMVRLYKETGDCNLAPDLQSYNSLLQAWGNQANQDKHENESSRKAQLVLDKMIADFQSGESRVKPDAFCFSKVIYLHSTQCTAADKNSSEKEKATTAASIAKIEELLFETMPKLGVRRTKYAYASLQHAYARSGFQNATKVIQDLVERMKQDNCTTSAVNYNAILHSISKATPDEQSLRLAEKVLTDMEDGTYGVEPDRLSYALTITIASRCRNKDMGYFLGREVLAKIEKKALSPDGSAFKLDNRLYNEVLGVLATTTGVEDVVGKAYALIDRMKELAEQGHRVEPCRESYNALLNAMKQASGKLTAFGFAEQGEEVLKAMWERRDAGKYRTAPDGFSYSFILSMYQFSRHCEAAPRAEALVLRMEEEHESGRLRFGPSVVHYTSLCSAWALHPFWLTGIDIGTRVTQVIQHMLDRDKAGYKNTKPNVRAYSALMTAFQKQLNGERAEELLYFLIDSYRKKQLLPGPTGRIFHQVLLAYTHEKSPFDSNRAARAEGVLERLLQYSEEEDPSVEPGVPCFGLLIDYYTRSDSGDAVYRAERVLHRLLETYEERKGRYVQPNRDCFTKLISFYAARGLPDGGERAERWLRTMKKMRLEHGLTDLRPDAELLNFVISAWARSKHPQSGPKAEIHLERMEDEYAAGKLIMRPDTRSYALTLSAWSVCAVEGKAERAWAIFKRWKEHAAREGLNGVQTTGASWCASRIINTCAFSNQSDEEQREAFRIGVAMFEEMRQSELYPPTSQTYLFFLQMCRRLYLSVPPESVVEQVKIAFVDCCKRGMLTDGVLGRLKCFAPEELLHELVEPGLKVSNANELSDIVTVSASQLTSSWSANASPNMVGLWPFPS